jgi:glucose-6-phosphate 1-dehydrogenase
MYSEVYSPKDELEIFEELFDYAISNNKKIHIVGITLKEELDILEKYYTENGYLREDVNCFVVDWAKTLVSVSVNIENLIWR